MIWLIADDDDDDEACVALQQRKRIVPWIALPWTCFGDGMLWSIANANANANATGTQVLRPRSSKNQAFRVFEERRGEDTWPGLAWLAACYLLTCGDCRLSLDQRVIVLYCTVLYCTLLYSTLLYSTLLYSTLLYSTAESTIVMYGATWRARSRTEEGEINDGRQISPPTTSYFSVWPDYVGEYKYI